MMFVAYIDESDTHGPAPDMLMMALLATARNWELFERGFRGLKREFGFRLLHGTNFRAQTGDFKDWPYDKHEAFMKRLGQLLGEHLTESFSSVCERNLYKEHFLDVRPRRMHPTSQYGICFEALVLAMIRKIMQRPQDNPRLSVVVEDGHRNAADTARVFAEMKQRFSNSNILRTHALKGKSDSDVLMAVDIYAYGTARRRRAIKAGTFVSKVREARRPTENEVGNTSLELTPGYFATKISDFNESRAVLHEAYLKRRETWLASKASGGQPS
ncbi:MAG: hypothetical protein JO056_01540 [Alphaproteobacteria bacterium]|nr:hypothetical protein [Alphaproteobacteria bacterium]